MKKIAICISGHLNEWETKYDSWINLFYKLTKMSQFKDAPSFDIFVHTWDFDMKNKKVQKIENNRILNFKNFVSPKLIQIDDFAKYSSRKSHLDNTRKKFINDESKSCLSSDFAPELYSLMMSSHLKRTYELDNNFEYDVCIGMTTDVYFDTNNLNLICDNFCVPDNKLIYTASAIKTFNFPYDKIAYNFFYADSHTFDVISSIYNMLPMMNEDHFDTNTHTDLIFGFFLRMFDIKIKRLNISCKTKLNLI